MGRKALMLLVAVSILPDAAFAASGNVPVSATISINGTTAPSCHLGDLSDSQIDVGTLANTADGTLADISGSPGTTIVSSWCNTGSKITVVASPLVAQNFSGTPPGGFTKAVNYTATETGWGLAPANDTTLGTASGVETAGHSGTATAVAPTANTIAINLSGFSTPSGATRLDADDDYEGTITVTLQTNAAAP